MKYEIVGSVQKILPALAILFIVVELICANEVGLLGANVGKVDRVISTLTEENEVLSQQVASYSGLLSVSARATELGLTPIEKNQIMTLHADQFALR
jgi:hypothetical protein